MRLPASGVSLSLAVLATGACGSPTTITFVASDAVLVAYQDDNGPWRALPLEADETYEIEVGDRFGLTRVCAPTNNALVATTLASPSDGIEWNIDCPSEPVLPPTFTVSVVSTDGSLIFATCGNDSGSGSEFELSLPEGACDLMVSDVRSGSWPTRFLRRTVSISGSTTIEVDMAEAHDLTTTQVRVIDPEDQPVELRVQTTVTTARGDRHYLASGQRGGGALVPPAAALEPGDVVTIEHFADIGSFSYFEWAAAELTYDEIAAIAPTTEVVLTLPPQLEDRVMETPDGYPVVTFKSRRVVRSRAYVRQTGPSGGVISNLATIEAGWWAQVGEQGDALGFPRLDSVAGWQSSWLLADEATTSWDLELFDRNDDGQVSAIVFDDWVAPTLFP